MDSITSDTLVSAIKDTLVRLNVKLTDCHGQCYDCSALRDGLFVERQRQASSIITVP